MNETDAGPGFPSPGPALGELIPEWLAETWRFGAVRYFP